jgi:hypothetical protein
VFLSQFFDNPALLLADGAWFESKSFSDFKVCEVLPHKGKEALLVKGQSPGEAVEEFAGLGGIGGGQIVVVALVNGRKVFLTLAFAMGEDTAALPDHPGGLLHGVDFGTQRVEMLPQGNVALLHEVVAQVLVPRRTPPAEFAYQSAVTLYQEVVSFVFCPVISHAKSFLPI